MPPTRADALAIVHEFTQSDSLRKHMLAVETAMRAYARKFGEDEEEWGLAGLAHDFDYERYPNAPTRRRRSIRLGASAISARWAGRKEFWKPFWGTLSTPAYPGSPAWRKPCSRSTN